MSLRAILGFLTGVTLATAAFADEPAELRRVPQVWASSGFTPDETDSLAAAQLNDGSLRIFATAKKGDRIDIFDAATGRWLASHGQSGKGVGQFKRPNGIATAYFPREAMRDVAVLVVERDNQRVQAFWADSLKPAGLVGEAELKRPYGIALARDGDGVLAFITEERAPRTETVRVYRIWREGDELKSRYERSFGEADGPGMIKTPESIAVDERTRRVLVCDEDGKQKNVKVYDYDGRFTGTVFAEGLIEGDPEGLVVCETPQGGVVILTDQQSKRTIWHAFDRNSYRHLGAFTGDPPIANTDGICLYETGFGPFPAGAFFAVNDDRDVRAYSLFDVLKLETPPAPTSPPALPPPPSSAPTTAGATAAATARPLPTDAILNKIAFGSCIRQDKPQPIWDAIIAEQPDVFVLLGDNVYGDTEDMALLASKYALLAANPGYAKLRQTCPLLATWDDHDYGKNDAGTEYPKKQESQKMMLNFLGEPKDSPRRQREGVYDAQVFGPTGRRVQIILLDTRYFRSPLAKGPEGKPGDGRLGLYVPNESPNATMLGEAQWKWLAEQLAEPAELRIIGSSIQLVAEDHRFEKWMTMPRERERLFNLIHEQRATGVLVLSGDRHLAELSVMDAEIGYDLYDITSSALNQDSRQWYNEINRHRWGSNYRDANFGLITIDWDAPDPHITLEIRQQDGQPAILHELTLSELRPAAR